MVEIVSLVIFLGIGALVGSVSALYPFTDKSITKDQPVTPAIFGLMLVGVSAYLAGAIDWTVL